MGYNRDIDTNMMDLTAVSMAENGLHEMGLGRLHDLISEGSSLYRADGVVQPSLIAQASFPALRCRY